LATDKEDYKRAAIADQMGQHIPLLAADELRGQNGDIRKPPMVTLCLAAGRKDKLRPGDILGALTGKGGIDGKAVGKIDVLDYVAYVAIERSVANVALAHLQQTRIKNRAVRVRRV